MPAADAPTFAVPATVEVPLAPCGEVLAGEDCGCGRTYEEVLAEVAALYAPPALTSPEAAR